MTGVACPKCGVAVTPGYVRCPKCRAPLPAAPRAHSASMGGPGGTAVAERRLPWWPFALAAVVGVWLLLVYVVKPAFEDYRRVGHRDAGAVVEPSPVAPAPTKPPPAALAPTPVAAPVPSGPTAQAIAAELERSLKHKRLWATVQVVGDRADIRSGACKEAGMTAEIDSVAAAFKAAGATRLRCLEQSGTVVFQRDL